MEGKESSDKKILKIMYRQVLIDKCIWKSMRGEVQIRRKNFRGAQNEQVQKRINKYAILQVRTETRVSNRNINKRMRKCLYRHITRNNKKEN